MDRAMNPHDGSGRRLKSSAHKSIKDYDRRINKQIKEEDTMESIEEGNKLIAEFMGVTHLHSRVRLETLKYNTSWDWLMPVIDEIVNLKDVYAQDRQEVFKSISPDITITYDAVVEFIKWYNAAANIKDKE